MRIELMFLIGLTALSILGLYIFYILIPKKGIKKSKYKRIREYIERNIIKNADIEMEMQKSEFYLSFKQYQVLRWIIFISIILYFIYSYIINNTIPKSNVLLYTIGGFVLSTPKRNVMGKKTPFMLLLDYFEKRIIYQKNLELYRSISQLKNFVIAKQNNPPSALFILEQLKKFAKRTKPVYNQTIYLWSMGRTEEACQYFSSKIGTNDAEELAKIFLKLDDLKPIELRKQLQLYQEGIKKRRETEKLRENENKSNLIYSIVIISAIIVLTNFLIVAYYIDTINLLQYTLS